MDKKRVSFSGSSGQLCNTLAHKQVKCKTAFLSVDFAGENCLGKAKKGAWKKRNALQGCWQK